MPADTVGKVSFHRFSYRGQMAAQVLVFGSQIFKRPLPSLSCAAIQRQSPRCIASGHAVLHSAARRQPMLSPAFWNQNQWRKSGQVPFTQTRSTHTFRANHRQCAARIQGGVLARTTRCLKITILLRGTRLLIFHKAHHLQSCGCLGGRQGSNHRRRRSRRTQSA